MDYRSYVACPGGSLYGSYPQGLVGNTKMYTTFTEYGHPSAVPLNNPYTIVFLGKIRDVTPGYSNFNLINSWFHMIEKHPEVTGIDKLPLKHERIVEHGDKIMVWTPCVCMNVNLPPFSPFPLFCIFLNIEADDWTLLLAAIILIRKKIKGLALKFEMYTLCKLNLQGFLRNRCTCSTYQL